MVDPLNLRGGHQTCEIATGVTVGDGWVAVVRLGDGREVGPVSLCQPYPVRTGPAGGVSHTHQVIADPPQAGRRVLVFLMADETIGVLM